MPRLATRFLALLLLACLLGVAGCRREAVAPGDPVAAVKGMAAAVRNNDLVRYSRLSMPPRLHQQMEARWLTNLALAAPPTAEQESDYQHWMGRLTTKDAEDKLYQRFDSRLKKFEAEINSQWPLMKATGGIFITGLIKANDSLTQAEKGHAQAVGSALLNGVTPAMLVDRDKARQAIAVLTATARELNLPTLKQTRQLEMIPALEKGGVALKGFKKIGRIYGLDLDASLDGVEARVVAVEGNLATMEVSYPLFGQQVKFELEMLRRDGRWYSANAVRSAEAELAQPLIAATPQTAQ
jgi:hypothetical protein